MSSENVLCSDALPSIIAWANGKQYNGVSTKYLSQYLNWFVVLEKVKKSSTQTLDLAKNVTANVTAIKTYRSIEDRYNDLGIPQLSKT